VHSVVVAHAATASIVGSLPRVQGVLKVACDASGLYALLLSPSQCIVVETTSGLTVMSVRVPGGDAQAVQFCRRVTRAAVCVYLQLNPCISAAGAFCVTTASGMCFMGCM